MSPAFRYHAHGLLIHSAAELPLPPAPHAADEPDLTLRLGDDRQVPDRDPPGQVLAALTRPEGGRFYCFARCGDAVVLRYPGLCEFVGDVGLTDVTVHLEPGADRGLVPVLAAGALVAVHLKLRHELVLHASAVEVDGRALAFVGASGMGKSTLAAALCREGYGLVSDDVLRADLAGTGARVHPGSTENRLRPAARELAEAAPTRMVRVTADGRLALAPRTRTEGPLPLVACVVPLPSRTAVDVTVRQLPAVEALVRMVQFPRVVGWRDPDSSATEFQALADLVERVPVFDASIPWGPPFRREILADLVDAVAGPIRLAYP
ncbi:AAA family ATPase [Pseudonocardia saturnea]